MSQNVQASQEQQSRASREETGVTGEVVGGCQDGRAREGRAW